MEERERVLSIRDLDICFHTARWSCECHTWCSFRLV